MFYSLFNEASLITTGLVIHVWIKHNVISNHFIEIFFFFWLIVRPLWLLHYFYLFLHRCPQALRGVSDADIPFWNECSEFYHSAYCLVAHIFICSLLMRKKNSQWWLRKPLIWVAQIILRDHNIATFLKHNNSIWFFFRSSSTLMFLGTQAEPEINSTLCSEP